METLGVESALYVGDREIDVAAAQNAGIDSVFLRREGVTKNEIDVAPTHVVSSLWDLLDIVPRHRWSSNRSAGAVDVVVYLKEK